MSAQEELQCTNVEDIGSIVDTMKKFLRTTDTLDLKFRQKQMEALMQMHDENAEELVDAFCAGTGGEERILAKATEVLGVKMKIGTLYPKLAEYSKPKTMERMHLLSNFSTGQIVPIPKGICLVLATWNFPNATGMGGLVKAIACGCPVIYKPTERNPKYSNLMRRLIKKYMDPNFVVCVTGGVDVATVLLEHSFGLIYFIGGTGIARKIGEQAGKTLTPMVLECGGINPCIVDDTCNVKNFANRMGWGANLNGGQLCIRPQYSLNIGKTVHEKFIEGFLEQRNKFPKNYKFIDERHFDRCYQIIEKGIQQGAKVLEGSLDNWDRKNLKGDLVLVSLNKDQMDDNILTNEEVFGPCTVAICIDNVDEAINFINHPVRDQPLALHIGSTNNSTIDKIINYVQAGSVVVNGTCTQHNRDLPMSGIGTSGMGTDNVSSFLYHTPVVRHWNGLEFLWQSLYNLTDNDLKQLTMIAPVSIPRSSFINVKNAITIIVLATGVYLFHEDVLSIFNINSENGVLKIIFAVFIVLRFLIFFNW